MNIKYWLKDLWLHLRICRRILTTRESWIYIQVSDENLAKILVAKPDDEFEVGVACHNLHPHVAHEIIERIASGRDDIERALDKAQFEAEAEIFKNEAN